MSEGNGNGGSNGNAFNGRLVAGLVLLGTLGGYLLQPVVSSVRESARHAAQYEALVERVDKMETQLREVAASEHQNRGHIDNITARAGDIEELRRQTTALNSWAVATYTYLEAHGFQPPRKGDEE